MKSERFKSHRETSKKIVSLSCFHFVADCYAESSRCNFLCFVRNQLWLTLFILLLLLFPLIYWCHSCLKKKEGKKEMLWIKGKTTQWLMAFLYQQWLVAWNNMFPSCASPKPLVSWSFFCCCCWILKLLF